MHDFFKVKGQKSFQALTVKFKILTYFERARASWFFSISVSKIKTKYHIMWQPPTFFFLLTSLQCFQNVWLLKYFIKLVLIKTYLAQLKTIRNMYLMAIVSPILASGMHKKLCRFLHPLLYISHRICISYPH